MNRITARDRGPPRRLLWLHLVPPAGRGAGRRGRRGTSPARLGLSMTLWRETGLHALAQVSGKCTLVFSAAAT